MRISDWSSDVCSSDLTSGCGQCMAGPVLGEESDQRILLEQRSVPVRYGGSVCGHATHLRSKDQLPFLKLIGGSWVGLSRLAWDLPSSAGTKPERQRVGGGKSGSGRVDEGGGGVHK